MAARNSVRVIRSLLNQVDALKARRAMLSTSSTARDISNPLLQDWTKTEPFGMPPFSRIEPSHFKPAFDHAMIEHLAELKKIVDNPAQSNFENVFAEFDRYYRSMYIC
jgi:peptidyl-dipeptidase Dcp